LLGLLRWDTVWDVMSSLFAIAIAVSWVSRLLALLVVILLSSRVEAANGGPNAVLTRFMRNASRRRG
jgi:hypothetical protein